MASSDTENLVPCPKCATTGTIRDNAGQIVLCDFCNGKGMIQSEEQTKRFIKTQVNTNTQVASSPAATQNEVNELKSLLYKIAQNPAEATKILQETGKDEFLYWKIGILGSKIFNAKKLKEIREIEDPCPYCNSSVSFSALVASKKEYKICPQGHISLVAKSRI